MHVRFYDPETGKQKFPAFSEALEWLRKAFNEPLDTTDTLQEPVITLAPELQEEIEAIPVPDEEAPSKEEAHESDETEASEA